MSALISTLINIICAFIPVLVLKAVKYRFSWRFIWISWGISLIGAFTGTIFGGVLLHRLGLPTDLFIGSIPAFIGAWLFIGIFLLLRSIPDDRW